MKFNKPVRGPKRVVNTEETIYEILDAGFLCHVAFQYEGQAFMIPTAYGRKGNIVYLHGSVKNHMLNQICNGQTSCICVTHLDGLVLARSLFATSVNYRSAILFGSGTIVSEKEERLEGMKIITENIVKGRWNEVPVGTENELAATLVIKFEIESASAKVREGGPAGDDHELTNSWSGHIPLSIKAANPVSDVKFQNKSELSKSVVEFLERYT
jgi:nitroimidazol reductase NimA-like FMN-containing flavoprotein (pyridoxamine 5'-phosphate oxidase superfamily)